MATNSTDVVMSEPKRKRAPQCNELDNPEIRAVIEFRYGIERRKLDEVVEEINRTYNLRATKYQYRDRLNKWGCKQRLNNREYHQVYHEISARQALGKNSRVFLNGTTELGEKRIKKWASRNITFTKKIFSRETPPLSREFQIARRINGHGLIRSPSPDPYNGLFPIVKKNVNTASLSLPLREFQATIERLLPKHNRFIADSDSQAAGGFRVLELIIYKISNDLYSYDPEGKVEELLEEVDESGLRDHFKKLLSTNPPYLLAARLPLATFFYLRKDDDMLRSMKIDLPQLVQRIYVALEALIQYIPMHPGSGPKQWAKGRTLADILSDLSAVHEHESASPKSIMDAYRLLQTCKYQKEHFSVFFKLWDPTKISVKDLESYRERFQTLFRTLLDTENASQLKILLEYGFSEFIYTVLLEAVVYDRHEIVQLIAKKLQIPLYHTDLTAGHENSTSKHAWELFDSVALYDVASKYISEIRAEAKAQDHDIGDEDWGELDVEDHLFVHSACIQPSMTNYVVDSFARKYSVCAETAALMAINAIPYTESLLTYYPVYMGSKRGLLLETLLREYRIDPNTTTFWKSTIWYELNGVGEENYMFGSSGRELLEILLNFGADINGIWEPIHRGNDEGDPYLRQRLNPSDTDKRESPLENAFEYGNCETFCYLLGEKKANIDRIYDLFTSEGCSGIYPEVIRALENRDVDAIAEYWGVRIGLDLEQESIEKAVEKGDIDFVKASILKMDNSLKRIKCAFSCACYPLVRKQQGSGIGYEILEFVLGLGADLSREPGFWSDDGDPYFYRSALLSVIEHDDLRGLILLLKFDSANIAFEQNANSPKCHHLQERGFQLLSTALGSSLRCFKYLLEQGFYIDEPKILWVRVDNKITDQQFFDTVLTTSIEEGSLDLLAYVLSEGANVFGRCGTASSAIEFAVLAGRIDSVALMLETVPACYPLALAAVESPGYEYHHLAEYVRNWKQDTGTKDSEMRGTVVEVNTEEDDVAWGDFIDLKRIGWTPASIV